jgi:hypothetical protein
MRPDKVGVVEARMQVSVLAEMWLATALTLE